MQTVINSAAGSFKKNLEFCTLPLHMWAASYRTFWSLLQTEPFSIIMIFLQKMLLLLPTAMCFKMFKIMVIKILYKTKLRRKKSRHFLEACNFNGFYYDSYVNSIAFKHHNDLHCQSYSFLIRLMLKLNLILICLQFIEVNKCSAFIF